jgi:hypothetical protein
MAFSAVRLTAVSPSDSSGQPAGIPGEGMPFDPGFPPDSGGNGVPNSGTNNPVSSWMTALTAAGTQVVQWFVLTLLLSEVTLFNGLKPQLGKNLPIVIWASIPLALMVALQLTFITGGGTISATGFSGFLDEWSRFAGLNIYLQSFVHALASQLTLFWLWNLVLLYIGARHVLKGKRSIVIMVIAIWVLMLGVAYSFQSYDLLMENTPANEEPMPEEFIPDGEILPEDMQSEKPMPDTDESLNDDGFTSEPVEQDESVVEGR